MSICLLRKHRTVSIDIQFNTFSCFDFSSLNKSRSISHPRPALLYTVSINCDMISTYLPEAIALAPHEETVFTVKGLQSIRNNAFLNSFLGTEIRIDFKSIKLCQGFHFRTWIKTNISIVSHSDTVCKQLVVYQST